MNNCYPIENTSNRHHEQLSGPYLKPDWWSTFQDDKEKFKKDLIEHDKSKKGFTVVRISHTEFTLFNLLVPGKGEVGNFVPKHSDGSQKPKDYYHYYESLDKADRVTTQIGEDFKGWMSDIVIYKRNYLKYGKDIFEKPELFQENYEKLDQKDIMDFPFDIIYGLVANKWFFKTFKNRIGLIGNEYLISKIQRKMKNKKYQQYLGTDYFTDYIPVPFPGTLTRPKLEESLQKMISRSKADVFLIGMGCGKMRVFYKLKEFKNALYIDIGHGIDAIAGEADLTRPYFGSWVNF